MNYKILIVVSLVMIIVGGIFSVTVRSYIHVYDTEWEGILFNEKKQIETNKIFLVGSSGIYPINVSEINRSLNEMKLEYETYNLSDVADNPKKRLASIENILKNEPSIVILGFGILEFEKTKKLDYEIWEYLLHPKNFKNKIFETTIDPMIDDIQTSPKERHLLLIKNSLFGPEQKYHPFVNHYPTNINKLEKIEGPMHEIDMTYSNENIMALEKIVSILQENKIKVVVITNPYSNMLLEKISQNDIEKFEEFFKTFSEQNSINLYFLHEKYSELDIWRDTSHIAIHPNANIYTYDVSKIILKEIKDVI
jgi:hypothetical protein